jgi:hypothetical protein
METHADWPDLVNELDAWVQSGRSATLWWRDDDAIAPTAELERLLSVAGQLPISLAVIPGLVEPTLADRLTNEPQVAVLQHGWRHIDHVARQQLSGYPSEYPEQRVASEIVDELRAGRQRLDALFGDRALPVFVPPFHGFHDQFLPLLRANGLTAISRNGPRRARVVSGILQVNAHVELIQWSNPPSFNGTAAALSKLVALLRARREGDADVEEPTGILTHHLVQDSESYRFIVKLIAVTQAHPAVRWLDALEVFPHRLDNLAAPRADD